MVTQGDFVAQWMNVNNYRTIDKPSSVRRHEYAFLTSKGQDFNGSFGGRTVGLTYRVFLIRFSILSFLVRSIVSAGAKRLRAKV